MRKIALIALMLTASCLFARPAGAEGAPVITKPTPGAVVPGASAVHFEGTATPNATLELIDTATGSAIGSTDVDGAGTWRTDQALPSGSHTVYAIEQGALNGSDNVSFDVDAVRPGAHIRSPKDLTIFPPGQPVQISGDAQDDNGILAVQAEYWLLSKLMIRKNVPCDGCGTTNATWQDQPALTLPGYYTAKVTAIDLAGNRSETMSITFFDSGMHEVPTLPTAPGGPGTPKPPVIQNPVTGTELPGAGSDPREGTPVVIGGVAQPGSIVAVYETRQNDGWWGRTVADGRSGRWSLLTHLDGGTYGVQARATNAQGRTSPLSARIYFTVDDVRPTVEIEQDFGDPKIFLPLQPVVVSGHTADDRHVIAVHLEYWLGSKLVLTENANCPSCRTQGSAQWTDTPTLNDPGYYYVNIISIDVAGNHSLTDSIRFVKTI